MAHPFTKLFDTALKKSSAEENFVLRTAEKLKGKGYRVEEIYDVLEKLQKSLVDDAEAHIVAEALEEFGAHREE